MKLKQIGLAFIVLVFGIWTVPKVVARFEKSDLETMQKAPNFSLINQNNKVVGNKDYLGKVYVLEFFFTSCPTICPKMNLNMKQLQTEFYGLPNFGIASITIDPENDTPKKLAQYAQQIGVKHYNWHLLTGNKETIFQLAEKGFNLYAGKNEKVAGGFEHSGLFALIDKEGNIRCRKDNFGNPILYYDGLEQSGIDALKEDIKKLLDE